MCKVKLFAGYRGLNYSGRELIHFADITNSYMKFEDGNWIGVIETGDSEFTANAAIINKSYNKDVNLKTMLSDTVNTLKEVGIDTVDALTKIESLKELKQKFGSILSGKSLSALDRLVGKFGMRWNINNNKFRRL